MRVTFWASSDDTANTRSADILPSTRERGHVELAVVHAVRASGLFPDDRALDCVLDAGPEAAAGFIYVGDDDDHAGCFTLTQR